MAFEIISQESYLGEPLPNGSTMLCKGSDGAKNNNNKKIKRLLLLNGWIDFEMISQECFLGVHLSKLLRLFHTAEKDGRKSSKQKNA